MSRKRYTPEQIISMLREAEVALAQGRNLSTILRHRRFLFTDSLLLLWK